jgi:hypothetical protein
LPPLLHGAQVATSVAVHRRTSGDAPVTSAATPPAEVDESMADNMAAAGGAADRRRKRGEALPKPSGDTPPKKVRSGAATCADLAGL